MIKELPCRFQQFLVSFGMLTVQRRSETGLFSHLPNHLSYETHAFFSDFSKFIVDFRNKAKN